MITYANDAFFHVLFSVSGTVFSTIWVRILLTTMIGVLAAYCEHRGWIDHANDYLTATATQDFYTFLGLVLGLLLSFRINFAYSRWEEGVVAMGELANAARIIVSTVASFAGASPTGKENFLEAQKLVLRIRKLVMACCILIMKHTQETDELEDLLQSSLITVEQYKSLQHEELIQPEGGDPEGFPRVARPSLVLAFLREELAHAWHLGFLDTYVAVQLNEQVDRLSTAFQALARISATPMPFVYAHFIKVLIVFYCAVFPFGIAGDLKWATPAACVFLGAVMFGVDQIAVEIEEPFGNDSNDIDVQHRIRNIDKETASIVACHIRDVVSFNCHLFWERQESRNNLATVARKARLSKKKRVLIGDFDRTRSSPALLLNGSGDSDETTCLLARAVEEAREQAQAQGLCPPSPNRGKRTSPSL